MTTQILRTQNTDYIKIMHTTKSSDEMVAFKCFVKKLKPNPQVVLGVDTKAKHPDHFAIPSLIFLTWQLGQPTSKS